MNQVELSKQQLLEVQGIIKGATMEISQKVDSVFIKIEAIERSISAMTTTIATLQIKSGILATISGALGSFMTIGVQILWKVLSK